MTMFKKFALGDIGNDAVTYHHTVGHSCGNTAGFDPDQLAAAVEATLPLPFAQAGETVFRAFVKSIPVFVVDKVLHGKNTTHKDFLAYTQDLFASRTNVSEVARSIGEY